MIAHLTSNRPISSPGLLLAVILAALSACDATENVPRALTQDDIDRLPPPSFTRGLLTRFVPEPLYPLRALNQRVEGWVLLHFDVNENGQVVPASLEIEDEQPAGYFTQSALSAARRLSFENTRGTTVEDIHYVFRYDLQEQGQIVSEPPPQELQFRELIPDSFITPEYPQAAERDGIEGYVVVAFTVTSSGSVENIRIVDSSPAGVFDQSALRAATRLRFEPRLVAGSAVAVDNVEYRFDWNLRR
ncbi:MAG: energy transducer TonB [Gammaproteobacteria bacterium]